MAPGRRFGALSHRSVEREHRPRERWLSSWACVGDREAEVELCSRVSGHAPPRAGVAVRRGSLFVAGATSEDGSGSKGPSRRISFCPSHRPSRAEPLPFGRVHAGNALAFAASSRDGDGRVSTSRRLRRLGNKRGKVTWHVHLPRGPDSPFHAWPIPGSPWVFLRFKPSSLPSLCPGSIPFGGRVGRGGPTRGERDGWDPMRRLRFVDPNRPGPRQPRGI